MIHEDLLELAVNAIHQHKAIITAIVCLPMVPDDHRVFKCLRLSGAEPNPLQNSLLCQTFVCIRHHGFAQDSDQDRGEGFVWTEEPVR